MITQPYHLYLERIAPERNMARFYALAIQPTLFGEVSLVRTWGRIGSRGQQMLQMFDNEKHAVSLLLELLREKRKRGYRPKPSLEIQSIRRSLQKYARDKAVRSSGQSDMHSSVLAEVF